MSWTCQRERDGIFESHQASSNNGAVGPGAGTRDGQSVAAGFLWPQESAIFLLCWLADSWNYPVFDVIGVADKFSVGGSVAGFLSWFLRVLG